MSNGAAHAVMNPRKRPVLTVIIYHLINVNRNRRIFIVVFIVFTTIVALLAIDMARRTTAPWNKHRELERALPAKDKTVVDTLATDTLLAP